MTTAGRCTGERMTNKERGQTSKSKREQKLGIKKRENVVTAVGYKGSREGKIQPFIIIYPLHCPLNPMWMRTHYRAKHVKCDIRVNSIYFSYVSPGTPSVDQLRR